MPLFSWEGTGIKVPSKTQKAAPTSGELQVHISASSMGRSTFLLLIGHQAWHFVIASGADRGWLVSFLLQCRLARSKGPAAKAKRGGSLCLLDACPAASLRTHYTELEPVFNYLSNCLTAVNLTGI